jgi:hypothetical protein
VLLEGKLGGKCAPDDTFWVLDDDESDSAEEGSKVVISLEPLLLCVCACALVFLNTCFGVITYLQF